MRLERDKHHRRTIISKQQRDSITSFLHLCYLNSTTFLNFDSLPSLPTRSSKFFNVLDNFHSLDNFSENNMFPIKPTCHDLPNVNTNLFKEDGTVVTKNWEPLVLGPAFAMERRPGLVCFNLKFSSENFSP